MAIHKININKSDEATLIAEKIIELQNKEIVLSVPRFSRLAESAVNFRLLKREAEALGKKISVESVDDKVIELCKTSGIECSNPFFNDSERKHVSDIVTGRGKKEAPPLETIDQSVNTTPQDVELAVAHSRVERRTHYRNARSWYRNFSFDFLKIKYAVWAVIVVAAVLSLYLGLKVLPRADIKLQAARTSWSYKDSMVVDKDLTAVDGESAKIPGQVFEQKKNIQLFFPATARKKIEKKAAGTIIIYNAYSSAPQSLVVSTRFVTPDGKIFRLADKVTVPGAKVAGGQIEPSSISARVVADKAGEAYNVGPVEKFTIPGFAGTPKASGFYASSKESMAGGFIGEAAYPSDQDIKSAKETTARNLEETMKALIVAQVPQDFKLLEGASKYKLLKQNVNTDAGADNKFSVFAEGSISVVVFQEKHIYEFMALRIQKETGSDFDVKNFNLNYGPARIDGKTGLLSFSADYEAVLAKNIDIESLKNNLAGKSENELRALIFSVAGLQSAKVELWPFWVSRAPEEIGKITITVD